MRTPLEILFKVYGSENECQINMDNYFRNGNIGVHRSNDPAKTKCKCKETASTSQNQRNLRQECFFLQGNRKASSDSKARMELERSRKDSL